VSTHHPSSADLVLAALAGGEGGGDDLIARHVRDCESCRSEIAELREVVHAVRLIPPKQPADRCLDEVDLAAVLDGVALATLDPRVVSHLAACVRCRAELAGATRLLREPLVAVELERLAGSAPRRANRRGIHVAVASGLAAAALAGLLLWPQAARLMGPEPAREVDTYRERTLTTTAVPRILGPVGIVTTADSLRWTSVPGADLYRITFWRRDGEVAWAGESRDTVLALPTELSRSGEEYLLWDVKARTGWDRWVMSDLVEITLRPTGGRAR
jgi:hypothetical protein